MSEQAEQRLTINQLQEAYEMLQEGMPLSVVAQALDVPISQIAHMCDQRCA